jgi:hypothetical protein
MKMLAVFFGTALAGAAWGGGLPPAPKVSQPRDVPVVPPTWRQLVQQDWLDSLTGRVTTAADAAGACDGVKNGKYGFHTGWECNPWWQVDLGAAVPIGRVVVYNRLDYPPGLHNADRLQILTSHDGRAWTLRHDNRGRHFGGVGQGSPLEVRFGPGALRARYVRLMLPSSTPIFFHLDEVEVYGPGDPAQNLALGRPADQSSLSPWSTVKRWEITDYPTAACIARARRLASELRRRGVEVAGFLRELDAAEADLRGLAPRSTEDDRRQLYLRTRWIIRRLVFSNPLLNIDRLLFVKRFCQETYPDICLNHMPWVSRPGGDLCILRRPFSVDGTGQSVRHLLNRALGPGHIHGMDLWFGGDRVVFGYARAKRDDPPEGWLDRCTNYDLRRNEEPTHIFEMGVDGRGLRQITSGPWSDLDPTYAPNGDIVFVSERCGTSLQCNEYDKDETSCNLYTMRPDGSRIRRLSVNKDGDYLPHALDDGSIGYTRWEYHERSFAFIQSLWLIRPDGTGADAIFKQHLANPWALEDVRSIPGSRKLVAVAAGHHTLAAGPLVIVDASRGMNQAQGIGIVTRGVLPPEGGMDGAVVPEGGVDDTGGFYSTPWALSEKFFLVAYSRCAGPPRDFAKEVDARGYALYLVDVFGNKELVYRDPSISCFIPVPLRARPRPPVLADVTDPAAGYATCSVSAIHYGCEGVAPQRIRYLRISEPIGWPYDNRCGGQRYVEDHNCLQPSGEKPIPQESWTPVRILGDVPVEADGSVQFRVPAGTAVYFQLLDENRMELRRMRSFVSFQPGESRSCVGCHESRAVAPGQSPAPAAAALVGPPREPLPPPWGDRPLSFLRDVQPVLDAHCVRCHAGLKPAGGLDFGGGLTSFDFGVPGYGYNRAYTTLRTAGLVSCSLARSQDASVTPPLAYGSPRSKLIAALGDRNHRGKVTLSADDRLRLVMWIDANAPYHDRFVNKRPGSPVYDLAADRELWAHLAAIHARRCGPCHKAAEVTRLDWIDIHAPPRSLLLAAPLPAAAGGSGKCRPTVYASRHDADYQAALGLVRAAVAKTWTHPRRDVQSLSPAGPTTLRPDFPALR